MDDIPVQDPPRKRTALAANIDHLEQQVIRERQQLSKWERSVLEDKYLKLQEDNLLLKKHARKQEEKLRKFAVKLVRLNNDKKKSEFAAGGAAAGGSRKPTAEISDRIEQLEARLRESEVEKAVLNRNIHLLQNQLDIHGHKTGGPDVQARTDSGIKRDGGKKNIRVTGPPTQRTFRQGGAAAAAATGRPQRYGHSLLEETRQANTQLAYEIDKLKSDLMRKDSEIDAIREQMRLRELQFDEDILELKRQATGAARSNIQENIDLMRLQREVKDKSTKLTAVQAQFENLNGNLSHMKSSHDALLRQLEDSNSQLKQEQSRVVSLQAQLKRNPPGASRLVELDEQITDLSRENAILKEANENLVSSAFDMEREREWRQRENALKVQIAQLEATLKADLGEKGNILDRLTAERERVERQDKESRELQREYYKLKEQHDELKEKMKFFTKESAVDFTEIEEALVLVKQRKEREEDNLDFLHKVSDEKNKDIEKEMKLLTADHAETIEELEKTRNMLIVQHQINRDYQQEVDAVNSKMEENKTEYETKLDEYAQLLDIRAARIRKLESQLRDVAYGTRQYRLQPDDEPDNSDVEDVDETIQLERGENLFEIHISKIDMSRDGLKIIGDEEPALFCTWEFFEFETQATPVVKSSSPSFSFTSQYVVKVDDFFLHHLQKESTELEVHLAHGTDYTTVASCRLRFRDIFDKPHGRVHGTADVISTGHNGAVLGTVSFWVRLKVPMDQALRLYKERMKALGYISNNEKVDQTNLQALDESAHTKPPDNVNQLHVKLIRCKDVKSRQTDVQPCPYCVYKFFDFPDHDTAIISNSNSPEFNDLMNFPVTMAADLDAYLKSTTLQVYVFDDTDPEMASYLGVAKIPLMALAHDKAIKGIFELKRPDGSINGSMDIFLKWQYVYLPPPTGTKTKTQMMASTPVKKESSLAMMPGESLNASEMSDPHISPIKQTQAERDNYHDSLQPLSAKNQQQTRTQSPPTVIRKSPAKKNKTVEFNEHVAVSDDQTRSEPAQQVSLAPPTSQYTPPPVIQQTPVPQVAVSAPPVAAPVVQTPQRAAEPEKTADQLIREELGETSEISDNSVSVTQTASVSESAAEKRDPGATGPMSPPRVTVTKPQVGAGDSITRDSVTAQSQSQEDDDEDTVYDESITEDDVGEDTLNGTASGAVGDSMTSGTAAGGGTYFEDSEDEASDMEEEEDSEDVVTAGSRRGGEVDDSQEMMSGSDSEGVMTPAMPANRSLNASLTHGGDTVVIEVSHLSLIEDTEIMNDPEIKRLFIAYNFLGINPAELETPISLPKPKNSRQQLEFNFRKVFHVDIEKSYEKRQYLASMLLPNSPDNGRIQFTVVCEPPEDDDSAECFDIGVAYVSLPDILKSGKNLTDANIAVYDVEDEQEQIGTLSISIECLNTLKTIKEELPRGN